MKKIFLSLTMAAALLGSISVFAADNKPGYPVKDAFAKEFAQVKDVEWTNLNKQGVYQAKFTFNNESIQAFFTEEGEFLGTTRQVSKSQLPILVINELDKKYADARFITGFEHSKKEGISYYITLVGKKGSMIIKATGSGDFTVYKRNIE